MATVTAARPPKLRSRPRLRALAAAPPEEVADGVWLLRVQDPVETAGLIGLWRESDRVALVSDCFYLNDMHGKPQPPGVPLDAYNLDTERARRSLRKLAELRPAIACPGHLGPLTEPDVAAQLEAAAAA